MNDKKDDGRKGGRPGGSAGRRPERRGPPDERRGDKPRDGKQREGARREDGAREGGRGHDRPRGGKPGGKPQGGGFKSAPRPRAGEGRASAEAGAGERIAKRLARAGIASRRDAEALIEAGRVAVNGAVLKSPAVNVSASDTITLDGEPIPAIERTRLFLFHKPAGIVTTNRDPEGRRTVFDALPKDLPRLMTVGRLDINTEGLLLLTNDGGLARVLELPATGWLRRYRVRVHGTVDEARLRALGEGVAVDGVFYGAVEASLERVQGTNAWLSIGLREGKNREVKNILGALGLEVTRLIRVSYGPFQLGELAEGAVLEVRGRTLREQLGERLIEEAGANFDAPVAVPFSNKPVVADRPRKEERPPAGGRRGLEEPGEGGLIRNRKRQREDRRENALSRLDTRQPGRGRKDEERGKDARRSRTSNVWMAPGARPAGKKAAKPEPDSAPERPRKPASAPRRAPEREGEAGRPASRPGQPARDKPFRSRADRPAGKPFAGSEAKRDGDKRAPGGADHAGRARPGHDAGKGRYGKTGGKSGSFAGKPGRGKGPGGPRKGPKGR